MEVTKKKRFRLDFAGDVAGPLAVILMETFWVYSWLIWSKELAVFPWNEPPLNLFSLFILMVAVFALTRFIPVRSPEMKWVKIGLVIVTVGIVMNFQYGGGYIPFSGDWLNHMLRLIIDSFNTLHPAVAALTASFYLAWRSIKIANSETFSTDIFRSFLFGMIAVIILIIVWTFSMGRDSTDTFIANTGIYIAGFFFFGLMGLAMGNFLNIRQKLLREKSAPLSNRRWFSVLFIVIAGLVVIGMAVSALFSPGLLSSITGTAGGLLYYLNYIFKFLFNSLGFIVEFIWAIMAFLINLVRTDVVAEFESPDFGDIEGLEDTAIIGTGGFDIMMLIKWIAFIIMAAFVLYMIYRALKRYQAKAYDSGIEEFSESLWSWLGFRKDIRLFFSNLFERWFGSRMRKMRAGLTHIVQREEKFPDDMGVREIYSRMLRDTAQAGHGRRTYETPYEYAGRVEHSLPGIEDEMDDLTDLYVSVRYGEKKLKAWETEHANVIWRLLHRFFSKPEQEKGGGGSPFV